MNNVTMIAAVGKNLELGKNNKLIWPLKEDLKFFREQTMGKPIVMGMNTFKSLPKMLPGRKHIILTSQNLDISDEILVFHSMGELLDYIESYRDEIMIIGGASLYKQFLEYAKKLIMTEIEKEDIDADVFFPKIDEDDWNKEVIGLNTENDVSYKHIIYTRK